MSYIISQGKGILMKPKRRFHFHFGGLSESVGAVFHSEAVYGGIKKEF